MFVRDVQVRAGGRTYTYRRLVENFRLNGKRKQRVVLNLGRDTEAARKAAEVVKALAPLLETPFVSRDELTARLRALSAREIGVSLVGNRLWEEAGIAEALRESTRWVKDFERTEALIRCMVLNRLSDPESKLGIFRWLKRAEMGRGEDRIAGFDAEDLADHFYRAMDVLLPKRKEIERLIYLRLRTLFSLELDLVFYDITSSYFEGAGPAGLAERGWSRDQRGDRPQILIGLLMAGGLPVAYHVFKGSTRDSTTVEGVLEDLFTRFQIRRVIFVGDRGMMTARIVKVIREKGQEYLFALKRRRCKESAWVLEESFRGALTVTDSLKAKEFKSEDGDRLIVCRNAEEAVHDAKRRLDIMKSVEKELLALRWQVEARRLVKERKIIAKAAVILSRRHGARYFDFECGHGQFRYFRKEASLKLEESLDGVFVLKTNNKTISTGELVRAYRDDLSNVDRAFRSLKSPIELRPIYHRKPRRVEAHVFLCVLSFLLECMLRQKLLLGGVDLTATMALEEMKSMRRVKDILDGVVLYRTTEPTPEQNAIMRCLGLKPPPPYLEALGKDKPAPLLAPGNPYP